MTDEQIAELMIDAVIRVPNLDQIMLERVLRAAIETVERYAGPDHDVVEVFTHGRWDRPRTMFTARPIATVTAIVEDGVELDPEADYASWGERGIVRADARYWGERVQVTYDPVVDPSLREQIVLDLVELEAEFRTTDRVALGDWSETTGDQSARRAELLAQLSEDRALVV
jgi:hypothetical protein